MGKSSTKPVIWLLLQKKLRPKEIIALGYKSGTVYSYNALWHHVKAEFKEKFQQHKQKTKNIDIKDDLLKMGFESTKKSVVTAGQIKADGVYVLFHKNSILYIGQTKNLKGRLRVHRNRYKEFDEVFFKKIADEKERLSLESQLTSRYYTMLNHKAMKKK